MNFDQTDFVTVVVEIINGFFNRFRAGTHNNDNLFGVFRTDIVNDIVLTAADFCKLVHFFLNNAFNSIIIFIAGFATLEENVRVLSRTADNRSFRAQCMVSNKINVNAVKHCSQIVIGQQFDFLDFVRSTETVKEMHERNAGTQC